MAPQADAVLQLDPQRRNRLSENRVNDAADFNLTTYNLDFVPKLPNVAGPTVNIWSVEAGAGGFRETQQTSTPLMSDLTREELDAKLDAAAARTEAIVARIEGKIDTLSAEVRGVNSSYSDLKEDARSSRGIAIASAIAIFLAVIATGWAVFSGITANNSSFVQAITGAFSVGRDVGQQVEQAKSQPAQTPATEPNK